MSIVGMKVFDEKAVAKLKQLEGKIADVLMSVKFDEGLGVYLLTYMGGVKVAGPGDMIPLNAQALAVANEGKWVPVGAGN